VTIILSLSACGNQEVETMSTNETKSEVVEEVEPTPTSEPIPEPIEEPSEATVVEENDIPMYAYSSTFVFPDDMEGFTRKCLNEDYPEWSVNETHYVDINGNEMNFSWEGPSSLGERAGANENTLIITYELIDNNSGKKGYARFFANADIGETYCFMYLERPEVFDEIRVTNIINSFDFWNYEE